MSRHADIALGNLRRIFWNAETDPRIRTEPHNLLRNAHLSLTTYRGGRDSKGQCFT